MEGIIDRNMHFRAMIGARLPELTDLNALGRDSQAVVALDQQSIGRLSRMDARQSLKNGWRSI